MKTLVIETVASVDTETLPTHALTYANWINKQLSYIPEEYVDSATINLERDNDDDYDSITLNVQYSRPETDEEREVRENNETLERRQLGKIEDMLQPIGKIISVKSNFLGAIVTVRISNSKLDEAPLNVPATSE